MVRSGGRLWLPSPTRGRGGALGDRVDGRGGKREASRETVSKTGLRVDWRRHEDDSGALLSGLTGQGFHRRPGGGATSRGGHARRDASRETRRTTCQRRWSRRVYGEPILVSAAEDGVDGRAGVAGRQRTLLVELPTVNSCRTGACRRPLAPYSAGLRPRFLARA
jgi:hypothetical protein